MVLFSQAQNDPKRKIQGRSGRAIRARAGSIRAKEPNRGHRFERVLKVMIGSANVDDIDAIFR